MKHTTVALLAITLTTNSVLNAQLVIDVTGVEGSGTTTWTFSGSDVAGGITGATFQTNPTNGNDAGNWLDFGDYTTINNSLVTSITGSASITVAGTSTESITGIYIDTDGGATADDFGVSVASNLPFLVGETVTWSGVLTASIDLNDLNETALPITFNTGNIGGAGAELDLQLNIVPEPSSYALIAGALALGSLMFRRRK